MKFAPSLRTSMRAAAGSARFPAQYCHRYRFDDNAREPQKNNNQHNTHCRINNTSVACPAHRNAHAAMQRERFGHTQTVTVNTMLTQTGNGRSNSADGDAKRKAKI